MGQSKSTQYEPDSGSSPKQKISRETYPTYTRAIVRTIPDSIRLGSERNRPDIFNRVLEMISDGVYNDNQDNPRVNLGNARRQHARYIQVLRDLGLEVAMLPADESTPDCPFVEDTCVVVGNRALLTKPKGTVRRRELDAIEACMRNVGLEVHRISTFGATLEGGDVVFTGTEFFVGNSTQSNWLGHRVLAKTFPEYPVHSIPLSSSEFHLKGVACCAAPGVIALAKNDAGRSAWEVIRKKGTSSYKPLWLPDCAAVDCIYVNGTLVHCSEQEGRKNCRVFAEKLPDFNRVEVSLAEMGKVKAALSSCSILF